MNKDTLVPVCMLAGIVVVGFLLYSSGRDPAPLCNKNLDPNPSFEQLLAMCEP